MATMPFYSRRQYIHELHDARQLLLSTERELEMHAGQIGHQLQLQRQGNDDAVHAGDDGNDADDDDQETDLSFLKGLIPSILSLTFHNQDGQDESQELIPLVSHLKKE